MDTSDNFSICITDGCQRQEFMRQTQKAECKYVVYPLDVGFTYLHFGGWVHSRQGIPAIQWTLSAKV